MIRYLTIIPLLIFFSFKLSAQSVDLNGITGFNEKALGIKKNQAYSADVLVAMLTKDKTSEKDKFDAIFAWVARNIRYSFASQNSVEWILKNKRTICLGYAGLMDTLCAKAGITNVTVYGYTKEEIFDVGDSLYVDNHAWNAVKLEGKWYVYDVTWSTGHYQPVLKFLSRYKQKLQQRFKPRYKNKKLKQKKTTKNCSPPETNNYVKQRFFNRLLERIIFNLRLRGKIIYVNDLTTDFYLSQPEVFGITHHADDPAWNLLQPRTMKDFERDSAFYYLKDSAYLTQKRRGSDCPYCDSWVASEQRAKLEHLKDTSEKNNPRNHFITGMCWRDMACILAKEQETEPDDSLRLKKIIQTEKEYNTSWKQYTRALRSVSEETIFHRKKNRKKVNGLAKENKEHYRQAETEMGKCNLQGRNYKRVQNKSYKGASNSSGKINRINSIGAGMSTPKPGSNAASTIQRIEIALKQEEKMIDSLRTIINIKKRYYDSLLLHLSLNSGQMAKPLDSLQKLFSHRISWRGYMHDDLKKTVVDLRKKINAVENQNLKQLKLVVHDPADTAYLLFEEVNKLIRMKQYTQEKCVKLKRDLLKNGEGDYAELKKYKSNITMDINQDICWYLNSEYYAKLTYRGLRFAGYQEKRIVRILRAENYVERMRGHYIDLLLNKRYIRHNRIAKNNIRKIRYELHDMKKAKREVQKQIKEKLKSKK